MEEGKDLSTKSEEHQSPKAAIKLPRITYASVTSTFALAISILTFYFSNLREVHSLQFTIANSASSISVSTYLAQVSTDLILVNKGNRTETILSVALVHPLDDKRYLEKTRRGPFVLKAGDALPVQLVDTITESDLKNFIKGNSARMHDGIKLPINVYIEAVSQHGYNLNKQVKLANIEVKDGKANVMYTLDQGGTLIELLE